MAGECKKSMLTLHYLRITIATMKLHWAKKHLGIDANFEDFDSEKRTASFELKTQQQLQSFGSCSGISVRQIAKPHLRVSLKFGHAGCTILN